MLSVIVTPPGGPDDIANLFARLVPAAVDGLVREVFYAAPDADQLAPLCEEAGARTATSLEAARGQARGPWLLIAPATFRPAEDWQDRVGAHLARGSGVLKLKGIKPGGLFARAPTAELRPL
jgi:hypothetical protein